MLTKNISNKRSLQYNQIPQTQKMQLHKKIFLTLAASLLFTTNYGNLSCFADTITRDEANIFLNAVQDAGNSYMTLNQIASHIGGGVLKSAVKRIIGPMHTVERSNDDFINIYNVKLILLAMINEDRAVFNDFAPGGAARVITEALLKMHHTQPQHAGPNDLTAFEDPNNLGRYLIHANDDNYVAAGNEVRDIISAMLRDVYYLRGDAGDYDNDVSINDPNNPNHEALRGLSLIQRSEYLRLFLRRSMMDFMEQKLLLEQDDEALDRLNAEFNTRMQQLEDLNTNLRLEIEALKAKDPEKSDPKTQAEIKKKEEEINKLKDELKKINDKKQKIIDQKIVPQVTQPQKNLGKVNDLMTSLARAAQNITNTAIPLSSSIMNAIANKRMNINTLKTRASEDEHEPVAAGSQTVDARIAPQSWDIWASAHMGNIRQDAANGVSANSQTGFYGGSIGIDKVFANNTIFGLALSGGESNTEYTSQISTGTTANANWTSNYYQADIYAHHNFTDRLFVQLIAGTGTYGDDTTIGNIFDFSSEKFTSGYHGNATIGYSIFGGEDSNFAITPKLGVAYYYLSIPNSIFAKNDSSTLNNSSKFTTLDRIDGIASVNIKIFNLSSTSRCNIKIIPEITAAIKWRFSDNAEGINANNIKLPVVKSTNSDDLSANVLAAPEQLFTLGGALTAVTNNNSSASINGSFDFAPQYLAAVGSISVKLSF